MKHFAELFRKLDETNKTKEKVNALISYFEQADDTDKLWTIALFSHRRPKRTINTTLLRLWASEVSNIPAWLFEESYHIVGDLAETISLVLPLPISESNTSLTEWINNIIALKDESEEHKKIFVKNAWESLNTAERFLFNKLITGGFRVGVSQKLMSRALAKHLDKEENEIAHRLMGDWTPSNTTYSELLLGENITADISRPYPFYLAYALENEPSSLGSTQKWAAEWKWDGIRSQFIKREKEVFIWSRGEELVSKRFPELIEMAINLPNGIAIDGEILAVKDGELLGFQSLQKRIGRKTVGKKLLTENPVIIRAYDLLEYKGKDIRELPYIERRKLLEELVSKHNNPALIISERVHFETWEELATLRQKSRDIGTEGFMLKQLASPYLSGRKKGDWWKWKVEPFTIDGVMIYAQRGHGRRSNLYSDFTFAVWDEDRLVPFTKAYSGLTDVEFKEITAWVKKNTIERFGPVSSVQPNHVFELAFEGIQKSSRHKSGIALRFPRIKRWRKDKPANEANTLEDLKKLIR
jgi:DNA ligase-1